MFSIITIASSTTKPVATVSAISERLSSEKPANDITPNVPSSDSGTATLGMIVAHSRRRNTKITAITRQIVRTSVNSTSCTDARIVTVRSENTSSLHVGRQHRLQVGQDRADALDGLDDVRAGLAADVEQHRGLAVRPRGELVVLDAVDDLRDIGQPHRRAVLVADDRRAVLRGVGQLIVGADGEALGRAVEDALRRVDVGLRQRAAHVSIVRPRFASCAGLTCTRTAGRTLPAIETRPTPLICDIFCAMIVSA